MARLIDTHNEFATVSVPGYPRLEIGAELVDCEPQAVLAAVQAVWGDRLVLEESPIYNNPPPAPIESPPPAEPEPELVLETTVADEPAIEPAPEPVAEKPHYPKKKHHSV